MVVWDIVTESADAIARRLAAIVESSDDAIVSKDLNGIVLSWNEAAERMFGYTADEMIGSSIRRIIPEDRQSEEDTVLTSIRAGRRVDHFETVRKRRDGRLLPISLTVSPILDASGVVIGASKIARDISDRKRAEQQAAKAAQRDGFLAEATLTLTRSLDHEADAAHAGPPRRAVPCRLLRLRCRRPGGGRRARGDRRTCFRTNCSSPMTFARVSTSPDSPTSPQRVIRTRTASFIRDMTDEMLVGECARR